MVAVVAFLEKNVMSSLLINIFDSIVQSTTFHSEHDSQIPTIKKTKKQPVCKNKQTHILRHLLTSGVVSFRLFTTSAAIIDLRLQCHHHHVYCCLPVPQNTFLATLLLHEFDAVILVAVVVVVVAKRRPTNVTTTRDMEEAHV